MMHHAEKELIRTSGGLYIFDFDGTVYSKDSMIEFIKSHVGSFLFYVKLPVMLLYTLAYILGMKNKTQWKESFLNLYLGGQSVEQLQHTIRHFADHQKQYMYEDAVSFINSVKTDNKVVVVSASLDLWLEALLRDMEVDLISTRARFENDVFKGIEGQNCNSSLKVTMLRENYDLREFSSIISFGNSAGDYELYKISNHYYHRFFG